MDPYVKHLLAVRDDLRRDSFIFCNLIEANHDAIEPSDVEKVRNLIEAAINSIEDIPIA
jgi:hypothetical protein